MEKIKLEKLIFKINNRTIELTYDEAKSLSDVLKATFQTSEIRDTLIPYPYYYPWWEKHTYKYKLQWNAQLEKNNIYFYVDEELM